MGSGPGDVTRLLNEIGLGNHEAESRLAEIVYRELHRLAKRCMFGERPDHTLQPTVLVHDAFVKLVGYSAANWKNREHFFAVAATLMRRILIDHAREVRAQKRGGGACKINLDDAILVSPAMSEDLVALDEALTRLAELDPRQSKVVELRFFAGLTEDEIGKVMDLSARTVKRDWITARAWLHDQLARGEP
jgi:RNA polymerase sigma-70 factor (ECF subfamily)